MNKTLTVMSVLFASLFAHQLGAQAYRWTNDQGNVVYSQSPPPDSRAVQVIEPPPPPAEQAEKSQQQLDAQVELLKEAEQERLVKKQTAEKLESDRKYDAQQCANARKNLETITSRPPQTLYQTGDGTYKRFTAEERTEQIERAQDIIEKHCR